MLQIFQSVLLHRKDVGSWTKFGKQDETWAEFSTLEVTVCMPCTPAAIDQNGLT
jgi:hypothetical protein